MAQQAAEEQFHRYIEPETGGNFISDAKALSLETACNKQALIKRAGCLLAWPPR